MTLEEKEIKRLKKKLKNAKADIQELYAVIRELQLLIDDYKKNYVRRPKYVGPHHYF
jgi:peptidoglycan hydrolase CwlO-like protein